MPSAQDRELPAQCCETLQRCPQFLFDPILARAILHRGVADIRYGIELLGCEQDDTGVQCFVKHIQDETEEKMRARYIVGCDIPSSTVRKAIDVSFDGQDLGHTISAILRIEDLIH